MPNNDNKHIQSTAKASFLIIIGKLAVRAMDLIVLMVLARILTPSDFGIIAMARTALFIIEAITELPISSALIREEKVTDSMLDTALTLGLLRGAVITSVMAVIAFPVAGFYHEPRLIPLMLAISFAPFFRGIQSPKNIINFRQMDFNKQIIQEASGKFIALVLSIAYAIIFKDYWALVIVTVSAPLFAAIASYIMSPMPYKPTLKDWHIYKDIMGWNFLSQTLTAINWQLEKLILPKYVTNQDFGYYSTSGDLANIPYQAIIIPIMAPLNVSFQKAKEENTLRDTYNLSMNSVFSLLVPIYGFIVCFPQETLRLLLGDKWLFASYILQMLAINIVISIPATILSPLANVLYKNKALAVRVFIEFIINIPVTFVGVKYFGIIGAIYARLISAFIVTTISILMAKELSGSNIIDHFVQIFRPIGAFLLTSITILPIHGIFISNSISLNSNLLTILSSVFYLLLYICYLLLIWSVLGKQYGVERVVIKKLTKLLAV